ncbi:MAG: bifunctional oligoribonuclease/PAP phosphatase NrnA [Firmicutes bacterium]|nr:bifunctional oligoribonuclease/PAP phosphatase NrnA [Bacillota bacterium]
MTSDWQGFFKLIEAKNQFIVTCHVHPDGDAIGSLLAVGFLLKKLGKNVELVCSEGVPTVYTFLEGSELIKKERGPSLLPEVLIAVDCAERERCALAEEIWGIPGLIVINIDHHITNTGFGNLNIVDSQAAATGEVLLRLFKEAGIALEQGVATALYTAVATDTGFFRYSNTSSFTLELAATLVKEYGVEPAKVAEQVHEQKSFNSIRLLGEVLCTLKVGVGGKVAWMVLDQEMLNKYPVENEETESFVNYARSIEGVEIGILFKELRANEIKLSWRSSVNVDVSKLAAYFGGGGHARAAGCTLNGPVKKVVDDVLRFVAGFYEAR